MAVFHARRGNLHIIANFFTQRTVHFDRPKHAFKLLKRNAARAQQARLVSRKGNHGRFHADRTRSALNNRRNLSV